MAPKKEVTPEERKVIEDAKKTREAEESAINPADPESVSGTDPEIALEQLHSDPEDAAPVGVVTPTKSAPSKVITTDSREAAQAYREGKLVRKLGNGNGGYAYHIYNKHSLPQNIQNVMAAANAELGGVDHRG